MWGWFKRPGQRFWALALLWGPVAAAWPVDAYLDVPAGARRFQRLDTVAWVQVEDPQIATAEVLPTGEVMVEGKAPGRTLLLAYADGRFGAWRIRVGAKNQPAAPVRHEEALGEARKRCPGLKEDGSEDVALAVSVRDEACRKALLELFQTDAFVGRSLELVFELPVLQSQLAAMDRGLQTAGLAQLSVRYAGAGLVLSGAATEEEHRRALFEVFKQSAGKVALDDQVEVKAPVAAPVNTHVAP